MGYGNFRTGALDGTLATPAKIPGQVNGGNVAHFQETFDLSKANVDKVSGTTNFLFRKPKGHVLRKIEVESSVSLGTSQLAFGIAGTPAKYGAAKAYGTTPKAIVVWNEPAQNALVSDAVEDIIMTLSVADLPAAGIVNVSMITAAAG